MPKSRVATVAGYKDVQVVLEYTAAQADQQIIYPGIQQCITVTGCTPVGLIGAHISPGSTEEEWSDSLKILKKAGMKSATAIYVIGNIHHFVASSTAILKTKPDIANSIKRTFGNPPILLYNTSPLGSQHPWGIDITAIRNGATADFTWRASTGAAKKTVNQLNGMYETY